MTKMLQIMCACLNSLKQCQTQTCIWVLEEWTHTYSCPIGCFYCVLLCLFFFAAFSFCEWVVQPFKLVYFQISFSIVLCGASCWGPFESSRHVMWYCRSKTYIMRHLPITFLSFWDSPGSIAHATTAHKTVFRPALARSRIFIRNAWF